NGSGSGNIIWRLGKDGDFTYLSTDAYPWFSHQHDGNFASLDPSKLVVFDNGNQRRLTEGASAHSRGQVVSLDEANRTATLKLNADLGVLSLAVGSAQALRDGNYHFDAGFVSGPNGTKAHALEVDPSGQTVGEIVAS